MEQEKQRQVGDVEMNPAVMLFATSERPLRSKLTFHATVPYVLEKTTTCSQVTRVQDETLFGELKEKRQTQNNDVLFKPNKASSDTRLREKYECVKVMRSNEAQESLARECELSKIIIEYKKRVNNMEVSHKYERGVHARESFYLIKENECLKEQVRVLEKTLADASASYNTELSQLRTSLSNAEDRLLAERERSKTQGTEQERVIQQLCSSLYALLNEKESFSELNNELAFVRQSLREMTAKCIGVQEECALWHELVRLRETFLLLERESLVTLQCDRMEDRSRCLRYDKESHHAMGLSAAQLIKNCVVSEADMYYKVKNLMLENAMISFEKEAWITKNRAKAQQLSELSEKHEALALQFAQYMRGYEKDQRRSIEQGAWLKALDDATIGYVLHQRDSEISVKLHDWKEALFKAHKLLRELLKRYEPFQRGDEVFVARVLDCLASSPHVKEPVDV